MSERLTSTFWLQNMRILQLFWTDRSNYTMWHVVLTFVTIFSVKVTYTRWLWAHFNLISWLAQKSLYQSSSSNVSRSKWNRSKWTEDATEVVFGEEFACCLLVKISAVEKATTQRHSTEESPNPNRNSILFLLLRLRISHILFSKTKSLETIPSFVTFVAFA